MTDPYLPPGCTAEEFEQAAPHSTTCKCEECDYGDCRCRECKVADEAREKRACLYTDFDRMAEEAE